MRRLWALTWHLPLDSATWHEQGFTQLEELVATHAEITDLWGRNLASVLGAKQSSIPKPVRIRRPQDRPKVVSIAEFAQMTQERG